MPSTPCTRNFLISISYGLNIPPAVLAAQGWLYESYFDLFRRLSGKISAVTIWGMADDDTWLDSFPVSRTDYPLPFDMGLQAKPSYRGIVDETKLPGYGLKFSATMTAGQHDTRVITVTATNGSVGTAYGTQINNFTLPQDSRHRCTPVVTAPGNFPISLGDIPANGTASASFTVSLKGCNPHSEWRVRVPWSSAVYETGTFHFEMELERDKE